jgi:outer membrane protein OmpA-like peptidoglycan-associated protein
MNEFVYPKLTDTSLYVIVNGYTDKIGSDEGNLKLSQSRAKAVYDKLINKVSPVHLSYQGFGAARPIFSNDLPEGRFYNRTVQLLIQDFPPILESNKPNLQIDKKTKD